MYQAKVRHPLSPLEPVEPDVVDEAMWALFVAIGEFWKTEDDPAQYRERLRTFMANRVTLNPLYRDFYIATKAIIDELIHQYGAPAAYEKLFTQKDRKQPLSPPESRLEFVQQYVINEFIALRLALGSFRTFGALNYCGYFGGANIPGQPVPYRPMGPGNGS
jgi:hypothetical protein